MNEFDEEQCKLLDNMEEQRKVLDRIEHEIVEDVMKKIPFKKIDEDLFMRIVSCSRNVLEQYCKNKEIYVYDIECNYSNNTQETIKNGEVHCRIGIAFTMADMISELMTNLDCVLNFKIDDKN